MLFARKDDAERVQAVLGKRLAKFGLELHPDKTRLIDFRPPAERVGVETTLPTTFTFLGFLHVWGKSKRGKATVWQHTAKDRVVRTLKAINQQCRFMRPWPIAEQHRRLCRMLEGHFAYFGITGNYQRLAAVVHLAQASIPIRQGCRFAKNLETSARFSRRVTEVFPRVSMP